MYTYILTDKFLLKSHNPYRPIEDPFDDPTVKKNIILAREEQNQEFIQLVYLSNEDPKKFGIGLVSMLKNGEEKKICMRKFLINGEEKERICYDLDPKLKFQEIVDLGDVILVNYNEKRIILDQNLKRLKDIEEGEQLSFVDGLNILKDPSAGKNLNSDDAEGKTLLFMDFGARNGANNIRYFPKYMLVKREDSVIVSIPKNIEDEPENVWANSP